MKQPTYIHSLSAQACNTGTVPKRWPSNWGPLNMYPGLIQLPQVPHAWSPPGQQLSTHSTPHNTHTSANSPNVPSKKTTGLFHQNPAAARTLDSCTNACSRSPCVHRRLGSKQSYHHPLPSSACDVPSHWAIPPLSLHPNFPLLQATCASQPLPAQTPAACMWTRCPQLRINSPSHSFTAAATACSRIGWL